MVSKFLRFLLGIMLFVTITNNCLGNTQNENSPVWQTREDEPSRRSQKDCNLEDTNKPVPLPPTLIARSAVPLAHTIQTPHKVELTTNVPPQVRSPLPNGVYQNTFRKDQPKTNDVVCIEKSKLLNLHDERLGAVRRNMDYDITQAAINQVSRRNEQHDEYENEADDDNMDRSGSDEQLRGGGYGNSFKCYACSNVSHSNCDQTSAMTTVKYCQRSSFCVKKVIVAEGVPILIRDCGKCETRYGGSIHCKACNSELCNGASSFNMNAVIFITITGLSVIFATKKL